MAQEDNPLVSAARTVGSVIGKIAKLTGAADDGAADDGAADDQDRDKPDDKPDVYTLRYVGSGAFHIKKPKRSAYKLHQSRVKKRIRGART